jgi:hypothetical protein
MYAFAVVAVVIFVLVERYATEPVLDLRFFRERAFSAGILVAFTAFFATFAVFSSSLCSSSSSVRPHPLGW